MSQRVEEVILDPVVGVAVRATVPLNELPAFFGGAFHEMADVVEKSGARFAGAPFARYHSAPPAPIDVEAVMPLTARVSGLGRVQPIELRGGPALQARHVGPYESLGQVYDAIASAMVERGLAATEPPREVYLNEPSVTDASKLETLVIQPTRRVGA